MRKDDLEEDQAIGPTGFVFQTPVRAKKGPPTKGSDRAIRIASAMGQIGRIARRRPEVMVKVTGSARGLRGLKEHLAYITRNGKILGERESGELILGATNIRCLAEDWWADSCRGRNARARDTINLMLSMPPGTDTKAVADAARSFAQKAFGEDYEYLLTHHNQDSDPKRPENPHAHLTVKTRGRHGQCLNPRKHDLQSWREAFALELRERGVIAEATPRRVRGITRKGQRQTIRHMDERKGSRLTQWKLQQAIRTVAAGKNQAADAPWEKAIQERQRKIRRAWSTLAAAFEQAGQPKLAQEIKQFVNAMPPVQTARERLVAQARDLFEPQVCDRGRRR